MAFGKSGPASLKETTSIRVRLSLDEGSVTQAGQPGKRDDLKRVSSGAGKMHKAKGKEQKGRYGHKG